MGTSNRWIVVAKVVFLCSVLAACGGGGGGGGGGDAPLPEVLVFDRADDTRSLEATADSIDISGEIDNVYQPRGIDCEALGNGSLATYRIDVVINGNAGSKRSGSLMASCRDSGTIFGTGVYFGWIFEDIPLELGDNTIVLETFDDGQPIGRDTLTVIRREKVIATLGSQATTTEGLIEGKIEDSLSVFRGIPYAAPPERFKNSQSPTPHIGIYDAREFGNICAQWGSQGPMGDENCLVLNIWAHNDDVVRPVIVFLHGGNQNGVSGHIPSLDGARLAREGNVIVVTLNRRLGVMGNLAIEELARDAFETPGNYGVKDVIAALQWLQNNLAYFNGDSGLVMLAGESAGAREICHILASPSARGLFHSAALQSAPCRSFMTLDDQVAEPSGFPYAVDAHRALVSITGCDTDPAGVLPCLRDLPTDELLIAADAVPRLSGNQMPFVPIIDGRLVQTDTYQALESELVGDIPVIVGSNAAETANLLGSIPVPDDQAYRDILAATFPAHLVDDLYALYPTADFESAQQAYLTLMSDLVFNCVAERLATAAQSGAPSYLYLVTRGFDSGVWAGQGAVHGIDVPYLFGTFEVYGYTPDEQALEVSAAMQRGWSGLAADPQAAPPYLPAAASNWPSFFASSPALIEFGDTVQMISIHREGRCSQLAALAW